MAEVEGVDLAFFVLGPPAGLELTGLVLARLVPRLFDDRDAVLTRITPEALQRYRAAVASPVTGWDDPAAATVRATNCGNAEIEYTWPLEFAELVWSDGKTVDRKIIDLKDSQAFGTRSFAIPFDGTGKKWVRFAVWDSAGNGAWVQPIGMK